MSKKNILAILMGVLYVLAGGNHLLYPEFYLKIMPPWLPSPMLLIYLSGVAEIVCGLLLIIKRTRRVGAWATIVLLIAVFPANIQMTINEYSSDGWPYYLSVIRLPVQLLLIYWAYTFTKKPCLNPT